MKREKEKHYFILGITFVICAYLIIKIMDNYSVFFGYFSSFISILKPFILAFIIAYLVNPVVVYFEKKFKLKRSISILASYLLIILLMVGFISFIVPIFYTSLRDLGNNIPEYMEKSTNWINSWNVDLGIVNQEKINDFVDYLIGSIPNVIKAFGGSIGTIFTTTISVVTGVVNFFIAFVVSCFILAEKEKFGEYSKKVIYIIFREKYGNNILDTFKILHSNIGKYIVGKFIDSIFVAICAIVGLSIIGSKYAILLGTIFGIANMIPYFGPIVTTGVAVLINIFASPMLALATLICLLIIQQIENLILDPKIVGKQLGLSAFFTLLAVSIGGSIFGIPGMILGTPVMAIVKMYSVNFVNSQYNIFQKNKEINK